MSHTPKARSIGSLPLPHQLRLTPCEPSPLPIRSPSIASPLANSSGIMSPSRLPASDCMSYFPPFECMGSGPSSPAAEAGPSTESTTSSDSERGHAKGRSLGSLAGLMTLLSPASSPNRTFTSSSTTPHSIPTVYRSTSDGDVLQALAKRVTPGKRRVLEPITLSNDHLPEAVRCRRRRTSSADVVIRRKLANGGEEPAVEALVSVIEASRGPTGHPLTGRPPRIFDAVRNRALWSLSLPYRSGASPSPLRPSPLSHPTSPCRHSHRSTTPPPTPPPPSHPPQNPSRHHACPASTFRTIIPTRVCPRPHHTTAPSLPAPADPPRQMARRARRGGCAPRRIAYAPSTMRRGSTPASSEAPALCRATRKRRSARARRSICWRGRCWTGRPRQRPRKAELRIDDHLVLTTPITITCPLCI